MRENKYQINKYPEYGHFLHNGNLEIICINSEEKGKFCNYYTRKNPFTFTSTNKNHSLAKSEYYRSLQTWIEWTKLLTF